MVDQALALRLVGLIDLTNLDQTSTEANIAEFLARATTSYGHVAAVCLLPMFVRMGVSQFTGTAIKVATVANFPGGTDSLEQVLQDIGRALTDGAQEIDVVFPYQRYLAGERRYTETFVEACRVACGENVTLKIILETGALRDPAIIADASYDVLAAGADFIKTSTGKISEGATLEAAAAMLLVIKHMSRQLPRKMGIKVSGGIRKADQAAQYVELADQIMGREWVAPATFRIGASQLLDELLLGCGI
jgi:deoxyribose-phosphate aldolase